MRVRFEMKPLKKWIPGVLVLALLVAAVLVVADFASARSFSDLCPESGAWETCKMFSVTAEEVREMTLEGPELAALLAVLEEPDYYKDGPAGAAMEGTICHLVFQGGETPAQELIVSDLGVLYLDSYRYTLRPDTVSPYLDTVLDTASAGE